MKNIINNMNPNLGWILGKALNKKIILQQLKN